MKAKLLKQIRTNFNIYSKERVNLEGSIFYLVNKKTSEINKFSNLGKVIDTVASKNASYLLFASKDREIKVNYRKHKVLEPSLSKIL